MAKKPVKKDEPPKIPEPDSPPMVAVHFSETEPDGQEHWRSVTVALDDKLLGALREHITIKADPVGLPDFDKMRLDAYRDYIKDFSAYGESENGSYSLIHTKKGRFKLYKHRIPHPTDTAKLETRLQEIDKMEKEMTDE